MRPSWRKRPYPVQREGVTVRVSELALLARPGEAGVEELVQVGDLGALSAKRAAHLASGLSPRMSCSTA